MFSIAHSGTNSSAAPFAAALRAAGWPVADLSRGLPEGEVQTLLFMPRDILESERLLFESQAWAKTLPGLRRIIIVATLSPRYVRALRGRIQRDIALIDAPAVGAPRAIESGQCSFLLGGPAAELDAVEALFDLLGRSHARMGEFGTAMAAKALQDCLSAASSAMTRSALDWAEAQGIDETCVLPLLQATFGQGLPCALTDPASLVANALPGDNAGEMLVRNVESALDRALKGVHLTPPRVQGAALSAMRPRHLH